MERRRKPPSQGCDGSGISPGRDVSVQGNGRYYLARGTANVLYPGRPFNLMENEKSESDTMKPEEEENKETMDELKVFKKALKKLDEPPETDAQKHTRLTRQNEA